MTEDIACEPLESIALDRPLHDALAHHHTQTRLRLAAWSYIHLEPLPGHPAFVGENRGIGMRPVKAPRARKRKFPAFVQTSNGQTCAAFGAACANNCATGARLHAHTESVRAFAPRRRRLISPFHDVRPVKVKSPLLQPLTPISVNVKLDRHRSAAEPRTLVDNSS